MNNLLDQFFADYVELLTVDKPLKENNNKYMSQTLSESISILDDTKNTLNDITPCNRLH